MQFISNKLYLCKYYDKHNNRTLEEMIMYIGPSFFDWQYQTYENGAYRPATESEMLDRTPEGHCYYSISRDVLITGSAGVSYSTLGSFTEVSIDDITDQLTLAKIYHYASIPFQVTKL